MCEQKIRMVYRTSGTCSDQSPPFVGHVTKRNGGSGDENGIEPEIRQLSRSAHAHLLMFVLWATSLTLCLWLCLCLSRSENQV